MRTIAEQIYPDDYRRLAALVAEVQAGEADQAGRTLSEIERRLDLIESLPQKLQTALFLEAVKCRLNRAQAQNLYLVQDDGQQIRMFNFMAEHFPVVQAAQKIANGVFLSQLDGVGSFTILDIGIGSGMQMASLVQRVIDTLPQVKSISVIGIEPSAESLGRARSRIESLADEKLSIAFTGIQKTMEQLDAKDWALVQEAVSASGGSFLVNASFALHHVQPLELRTALFRQLKRLSPKAFVIIEPYADYTGNDLLTRFKNAWHHYGLTFKAIDTVDADEEDKNALKRVFFGREMIDVLSQGNRIEQFETMEQWAVRLRDAGFSVAKINQPVPENFNALVQVEATDAYVGFNVSGCPIVTVFCAV